MIDHHLKNLSCCWKITISWRINIRKQRSTTAKFVAVTPPEQQSWMQSAFSRVTPVSFVERFGSWGVSLGLMALWARNPKYVSKYILHQNLTNRNSAKTPVDAAQTSPKRGDLPIFRYFSAHPKRMHLVDFRTFQKPHHFAHLQLSEDLKRTLNGVIFRIQISLDTVGYDGAMISWEMFNQLDLKCGSISKKKTLILSISKRIESICSGKRMLDNLYNHLW